MPQVLVQPGATGNYVLGTASPSELGSIVVQTEGLASGGNAATIKFQGRLTEASTWVDITYVDQRTQGNPITPGTTQTVDSIWAVRADGMLVRAVIGGTIATAIALTSEPVVGGG